MPIEVAHRRWWQIFEVVVGLPFLAALALHLAAPLSLPSGFLSPAFVVGGTVLVIVGTTFVVLARREFAQQGQPTDPGLATTQIITTGVFSISRNPLYLGGVCVLVGISLILKLTWGLVLLLPALVACHLILIVPEERYLASRFGAKYERYAATVHRWVGRKRI